MWNADSADLRGTGWPKGVRAATCVFVTQSLEPGINCLHYSMPPGRLWAAASVSQRPENGRLGAGAFENVIHSQRPTENILFQCANRHRYGCTLYRLKIVT